MIKKIRYFLMFTIIFCIVFTYYSYANEKINLFIDITDTPKYREIQNYVYNHNQYKNIDIDKAVKLYPLNKLDGIDDINNAIKTNSYIYKIPISEKRRYSYFAFKVENKEVISYETHETANKSLATAKYLFEPNLVNDVIAKSGLEVSDVNILTIPVIKTDFVYFKSADKHYVIPFSSRPDFLEIENGKIYEFDDFAWHVNELLQNMQTGNNHQFEFIIFFILLVIIIFMIIFIIVTVAKRKSVKHNE